LRRGANGVQRRNVVGHAVELSMQQGVIIHDLLPYFAVPAVTNPSRYHW
jgi:hypothetical protein